MDEDRCMFERFLVEAADDIRQYETARGRDDHDGQVEAADALDQLRMRVCNARDWWMRVEIYYQQSKTQLPWWGMQVADDLPVAIRQYLEVLQGELDLAYLPGAGAALLRIQQLIGGTAEDFQEGTSPEEEDETDWAGCRFCGRLNPVGREQKQFQCEVCGKWDTIDWDTIDAD